VVAVALGVVALGACGEASDEVVEIPSDEALKELFERSAEAMREAGTARFSMAAELAGDLEGAPDELRSGFTFDAAGVVDTTTGDTDLSFTLPEEGEVRVVVVDGEAWAFVDGQWQEAPENLRQFGPETFTESIDPAVVDATTVTAATAVDLPDGSSGVRYDLVFDVAGVAEDAGVPMLGALGDLTYQMTFDDDDQIRQVLMDVDLGAAMAAIAGDDAPEIRMRLDLRMDDYGTPVDITAPS